MSLNLTFHISDFHNLKIINNIFFFIFEGGLIILYRGIYIYIYREREREHLFFTATYSFDLVIVVPLVLISLVLFLVAVFKSLYRYVHAVFNAGKSFLSS